MIKRTLYFGNPAYLSLSNEQLVIRRDGHDVTTTPIEDLGVVIIDHQQVTISHGAIVKLLEYNVALVVSDSTHLPAGLLLPLSANSIQAERFRSQLAVGQPLKKRLWKQVVVAKIRNQAKLLNILDRGGDKKLLNLVGMVQSGDRMNHESQAAVIYWKLLFSQDHFVRRRIGPPPNSLLNYGYAILRAVVARALVGTGLLPTLGIHHHNRYNAYALADDLMEPYRPFVDRVVVEMVESNVGDELTPDVKRELLQIPTLEVLLGKEAWRLMDGVDRSAHSLLRCMEKTEKKLALPTLCP